MPPRIAVSQCPYLGDVSQSLERAVQHMHQAASHGADVMVFPEWFLGVNPVDVLPNRLTLRLSQAARELSLTVVTGSLRVLDLETGKKQQRGVVINRDGSIVGDQSKIRFQPREQPWFEPGIGMTRIPSDWGSVVILLGLDGSDSDRWRECRELSPDIIVIAHSFDSARDRTAMQEFAVTQSLALDATVVLAPLMGRFLGVTYLPGALIADRGHILSVSDREGLVVAGDPESPLIQLGATDIAAYARPSTPAAAPSADPMATLGAEAERRVFMDWNALIAPDPLVAGGSLLALVHDKARVTALAPARPHQARALEVLLSQGARGAFAYPGLDRLSPWSREMRALGAILASSQRPLLVHTGPGRAPLRYDHPLGWDEFCQEFPSVPLVLVHMGGRSPFLEEALLLAERHRQVFLETSGVPITVIQEAIQELGRDRMLFGSGGIPDQFTLEWQKISQLETRLSPDAFQALVSRNGRRLFFDRASDSHALTRDNLSVIRRPG